MWSHINNIYLIFAGHRGIPVPVASRDAAHNIPRFEPPHRHALNPQKLYIAMVIDIKF